MTKILIIDDHVVTRTGIKFLLYQKFQATEIHEAFDGESARQELKSEHFELIIMDVQMPNTDTLALMEYIKEEYPAAKVLVYSMSPEKIFAKRFIKSGAMGFLSKDAPLQEITRAIETVVDNKMYISESIAEILADDAYAKKAENPFDDLSKREFEIARLLLSGKTLTDISLGLNIQTSTVGTHKQRLFEKLAVTNIVELKDLAATYKL